jgi:hypothetical protein
MMRPRHGFTACADSCVLLHGEADALEAFSVVALADEVDRAVVDARASRGVRNRLISRLNAIRLSTKRDTRRRGVGNRLLGGDEEEAAVLTEQASAVRSLCVVGREEHTMSRAEGAFAGLLLTLNGQKLSQIL